MKKMYIAPDLEQVKLDIQPLMATSTHLDGIDDYSEIDGTTTLPDGQIWD